MGALGTMGEIMGAMEALEAAGALGSMGDMRKSDPIASKDVEQSKDVFIGDVHTSWCKGDHST